MGVSPRQARPDWLALAPALLALCVLVLQRAPFQLDDAFITFRYAGNLALHHSLSFNLQDGPVEGFSSPLWLLMLAAVAALLGKAAVPDSAIALGVAGAVFALLLMQRLVARGEEPGAPTHRLWRAVETGAPVLWLAVMPAFIRYASTGLEHPWFLACVLGVASACAGRVPLRLGLLCAALAPWFRPEGAWVAVASVAQRWTVIEGGTRARLLDRTAWAIGLSACGSQLLLLLVRWLLFEDLLPNTYWAKPSQLGSGFSYVADLLRSGWGMSIAAAALIGALVGTREHRGYAAAGVAWLLAAGLEGGDWMPDGRLALPGLALLIAASTGIFVALPRFSARGARARAWACAALVALGAGTALAHSRDTVRLDRANFRSIQQEDRVLAQWLIAARARSVALVDIGVIGFIGDQQLTDLVGLTDRVIARSSGRHLRKDFDLGYVFDTRRPDVIVLRLWAKPTVALLEGAPDAPAAVMGGIEERIVRDPRLQRDYRLLFAQLPYKRVNPYYGRLVYGRSSFAPAVALPERLTYVEELQE